METVETEYFSNEIKETFITSNFQEMALRVIPLNDRDPKADLARKILVQAIAYTCQHGGNLMNVLLCDRQVDKWTGGRTWDVDVAQCYAIGRVGDYEQGKEASKRVMQEFAQKIEKERKDKASKGLLGNFLAFLRI